MLTGLGVLGLATGSLASLGALETFLHRRRLARIPYRLHVSGTRGKSSVTRLVAAGLRSAGVPTLAKTTGTLARVILPDGHEVPVFRPLGANIIEQTRIVRLAAEVGARALVIECMALQPYLHWLSESKLVRGTHGIITNARADHLEVMGPGEADVAKCLAGMIPVRGKLFTAERRHLSILADAAKDRGTQLFAVDDDDLAAVKDEWLTAFRYTEHRENMALAFKVLADLGVTPEQALPGMWTASPDPGVLSTHVVDFFGRRIIFVNAFAANDPESTGRIWEMCKAAHPDRDRIVAVFNMRADRPARTIQLAQDASFWREADSVVLMGTGAYLFSRCAQEVGFDTSRIVYADTPSVEDIFEQIVGACGGNTLVIGMGNIGGQGLALVRFFRNRGHTAAVEAERRRGPLPSLEKNGQRAAAVTASGGGAPSAPAATSESDSSPAPAPATAGGGKKKGGRA
jgi:poly-gamma-glutamate synthase PgsB/CapB